MKPAVDGAVLARPRDRAGRRTARDHEAEDRRRHERHPRRRPGVPDVPHQGGDGAGLLPGVGRARLRVHRHRGVRAPVRPEAVGARVRRVAAAGANRRRHRRARQPDHLADGPAADGEDVPRAGAGPARLLHRGAPRRARCSPPRRSRAGLFRFPSATDDHADAPAPVVGTTTASGPASTSPAATTRPSIWWDPDATGPDEVGRDGKGCTATPTTGARYLPGKWPTKPVGLYDDATSVTVLTQLPADAPPTYPSPAELVARYEPGYPARSRSLLASDSLRSSLAGSSGGVIGRARRAPSRRPRRSGGSPAPGCRPRR